MKTIDDLKKGDSILYIYKGNLDIAQINKVTGKDYYLKQNIFLPSKIKKNEIEILAIENMKEGEKIKGFSGRYDILQREKLEKLLENEKETFPPRTPPFSKEVMDYLNNQ